MSSVLKSGVRLAAPSAALLIVQKAVAAFTTFDVRGRDRRPPSREALVATVERRQAEYDDVVARQPAASPRKLRLAALALADAKDDLFRHDVGAWLAA